MIAEIEKIIKSKAYIELTADERLMINEWAEDEEAFNEMKWFLIESEKAVQTDKIEASSVLKKNVMAHLTTTKNKKGVWLSTSPLTGIEKTKKLYQKPLFQLAMAACLVIGFLVFYTAGLKNNSLALNANKSKDNAVQDPEQKLEFGNNSIGINDQEKSVSVLKESEANTDSKEDVEVVVPPKLEKTPIVVTDTEVLEELLIPNEEVADEEYYFEVAELLEEAEEVEEVEPFVNEQAMEITPAGTQSKINRTEGGLFKNERKQSKRTAERLKKGESIVSANQSGLDESDIDIQENAKETLEKETVSTHPKSLHINETKKFNQLFFIVK